jgi:prepilin-type N-terminal cleavage/methylation domain-containing protein
MTTGDITMVATEKGFTLIEVLVALGVFSVALLGLEKMHLTAIQVNTVANRLTQATTLAQDRVERFMAMPYDDPLLADTTAKGIPTSYPNAGHPDPSPPPQGYTIRWDVDTDVPSVGIKTINIFVTWNNLRASKTFSLSMRKSNL